MYRTATLSRRCCSVPSWKHDNSTKPLYSRHDWRQGVMQTLLLGQLTPVCQRLLLRRQLYHWHCHSGATVSIIVADVVAPARSLLFLVRIEKAWVESLQRPMKRIVVARWKNNIDVATASIPTTVSYLKLLPALATQASVINVWLRWVISAKLCRYRSYTT